MSSTPPTAEPAEAKPHKSLWDTVITSTPVVMTVVATILAGLSSGEMSRAQYLASLSAKMQSKVGDQWNFFQAKRLRDTGVDNTLKQPLLQGGASTLRFDATALNLGAARVVERLLAAVKAADGAAVTSTPELKAALSQASGEAEKAHAELTAAVNNQEMLKALTFIAAGELPHVEDKPVTSAAVRNAIKAVESPTPASDEAVVLATVNDKDLAAEIHTTDENAAAFDAAAKPVGKAAVKVSQLLARLSVATTTAARAVEDWKFTNTATATTKPAAGDGSSEIARLTGGAATDVRRIIADFTAAQLRYDSARYQRESAINLVAARLYEIQARKLTVDADRHRVRSGFFFYGMLGAQAAVTLASLALAVKERSIFWTIATVVGFCAMAFGGYVYLFK